MFDEVRQESIQADELHDLCMVGSKIFLLVHLLLGS